MISGRVLHYVFKVADRPKTAKFYVDVLGMKVLRHEEFTEGCEAACNGPYDNRWSKTMFAYGSEDTHFAVEITYNYGITSYEKGNDFCGVTIRSKEAIERAKKIGWPVKQEGGLSILEAPGDYKYFMINEPQPTDTDPVQKVALASSNLKRSIDYWHGILGLKIFNQTTSSVLLGFAENQAKLELQDIGGSLDRGQAYGRIAFSCPYAEQPIIDKKIREVEEKILTPLITLDTPGKASVRVIILADPDGHEICFVEDEGYRQLSQPEPHAVSFLERNIVKEAARPS